MRLYLVSHQLKIHRLNLIRFSGQKTAKMTQWAATRSNKALLFRIDASCWSKKPVKLFAGVVMKKDSWDWVTILISILRRRWIRFQRLESKLTTLPVVETSASAVVKAETHLLGHSFKMA